MLRYSLLLLCSFFLLTSPLAAEEISGTVSWIYDGDTLLVENVGKVRLLGIDTPETKNSSRDLYYLHKHGISRKRLRQVARQGKHFNIERVKGQQVRLVFDAEQKDQHDRTLAYLYLPDGRMLNRLLLEKGLASVFRRYPFRHKEDFLAAEKTARELGLGLWRQ